MGTVVTAAVPGVVGRASTGNVPMGGGNGSGTWIAEWRLVKEGGEDARPWATRQYIKRATEAHLGLVDYVTWWTGQRRKGVALATSTAARRSTKHAEGWLTETPRCCCWSYGNGKHGVVGLKICAWRPAVRCGKGRIALLRYGG